MGGEVAATLPSSRIEQAIGNGIFDSAARLVGVATVRKPAAICQRPQISKGRRHLGSDNFPELKLANSWRIDKRSTASMGNESRCGCGVAALLVVAADFCNREVEHRIEGI